jgi:hypothetical protein
MKILILKNAGYPFITKRIFTINMQEVQIILNKKHGRFYTNENNEQIAEMVIGISGNDLTILCGYMGK